MKSAGTVPNMKTGGSFIDERPRVATMGNAAASVKMMARLKARRQGRHQGGMPVSLPGLGETAINIPAFWEDGAWGHICASRAADGAAKGGEGCGSSRFWYSLGSMRTVCVKPSS